MKKAVFNTIVQLNARPVVARSLKKFAMSRWSRPLIKPFIRTYDIRLEEALLPLPAFHSLHDFFVRELKAEARPVAVEDDAFVSPCDAVLSVVPDLTPESQFVVKGQHYMVAELIGSKQQADTYANGVALILYLSPKDYHRVHTPVSGEIETSYTLGKESVPVNTYGLTHFKRPLTRNYRRVTRIRSGKQTFEHVMVGALNVNTIVETHAASSLTQGEEFGYFSFGSTVILICPADALALKQNVEGFVRLGQSLGQWNGSE
ncbi:phosphatidylserine decarboxylase [Exiguobacterium oxidotolerans]|uniref:phosphatidylserine decarboxylase n=1 Tax=Exiguobacterium oxidotolerans TaxID=223958 RepID=A0A653I6W8_9BACL|nr:phosphatidylserine decarboxylase [Exiguobacterium oxidotolerans]VWX34620.1 Phosphatidylserine decarboxylase proenzyme [Exiguobacterium oxidotolerans]